jgi:hypothetical protein
MCSETKWGETMIQEGLLWFDDDPRWPTSAIVARAAARYKQKYGRKPNVCYVHPLTVIDQDHVGEVEIMKATTVLPHHFWLGHVAR